MRGWGVLAEPLQLVAGRLRGLSVMGRMECANVCLKVK